MIRSNGGSETRLEEMKARYGMFVRKEEGKEGRQEGRKEGGRKIFQGRKV
jgi:hypothetical protein